MPASWSLIKRLTVSPVTSWVQGGAAQPWSSSINLDEEKAAPGTPGSTLKLALQHAKEANGFLADRAGHGSEREEAAAFLKGAARNAERANALAFLAQKAEAVAFLHDMGQAAVEYAASAPVRDGHMPCKVKNSMSLPVATQRRSSNASVEPNAQQLPHEDWSRTLLMTVQFFHAVRESKAAGTSASSTRTSLPSGRRR